MGLAIIFHPIALFLVVGSLLGILLALLPAPDRPEPTVRETPLGLRLHRVEEGDSLRGLARHYYDDPGHWHRIFIANRMILERDHRLVPGGEIVIPDLRQP